MWICSDVRFVVDGFRFLLLESPPSRVPASRKPLDNRVLDVPIVRICNIHPVSCRSNRLFDGYPVDIFGMGCLGMYSYSEIPMLPYFLVDFVVHHGELLMIVVEAHIDVAVIMGSETVVVVGVRLSFLVVGPGLYTDMMYSFAGDMDVSTNLQVCFPFVVLLLIQCLQNRVHKTMSFQGPTNSLPVILVRLLQFLGMLVWFALIQIIPSFAV